MVYKHFPLTSATLVYPHVSNTAVLVRTFCTGWFPLSFELVYKQHESYQYIYIYILYVFPYIHNRHNSEIGVMFTAI